MPRLRLGNALTADLGKALRKDADPACLSAKAIAPVEPRPRSPDQVGHAFDGGTISSIDPKVYAAQFPATAELERLKQNADVKRYLALAGPMRQAKVLDAIVEQFSRYVLIAKL